MGQILSAFVFLSARSVVLLHVVDQMGMCWPTQCRTAGVGLPGLQSVDTRLEAADWILIKFGISGDVHFCAFKIAN